MRSYTKTVELSNVLPVAVLPESNFRVNVPDQWYQGTVMHAIMRPNTTRARVRAA